MNNFKANSDAVIKEMLASIGENSLEIGYEGEGSLEIVDVDVEIKYGKN